jgi:hypothetical protein
MVGQRLSYSVGFTLPDTIADTLATVAETDWQIAYDSDGQPRPGAAVVEVTGLLDLSRWPKGMRVIVRRERPHPGAQLRLTDHDGNRLTAFATNTAPGGPGRQLADLELRHRRRARAEDRIRTAKDTGLRNLPLHELDQNRIWCAIVALACELTAWAQMLALPDHPARRWEPNTPAAADLLPRRTADPLRPTHRPTPRWSRALGGAPARGGHHPARASRTRLTRRDHAPTTHPARPVEPAPTRATSAELSYPSGTITRRTPAPTGLDHHHTPAERSGLAEVDARDGAVSCWRRWRYPGRICTVPRSRIRSMR